MTIRYNQKLISNHLRKDWQRRVRTHFDQPGSKSRRRESRRAKAAAVAPRPVDKLRPVVRCPTIKHNRRVREGRGFTIEELKAAGIPRKYAPTIGIAVDHRRQNLSEESIAVNAARLKDYQSRLIVLPRRSNAPKKGETKASDLAKTPTTTDLGASFPLPAPKAVDEVAVGDMPKPIEGGAYRAIRDAWANQRHQGKREKRARERAEAETAKK